MKIYIAGKITGRHIDEWQEQFYAAQHKLTRLGLKVKTPIEISWYDDFVPYNDLIKMCKILIDNADAVYMLKGWRDSKGASLECKYAIENGKQIFYEGESEPPDMRERI
jgi:hypothetical protein